MEIANTTPVTVVPASRWTALPTIVPAGPKVRHTKEAAIFTRRLADLAKFRKLAESGKHVGQFFSAADAENEALRRELMLRHDIHEFNLRHKMDPTDNAGHMAAVRATLDDRDAHRMGG